MSPPPTRPVVRLASEQDLPAVFALRHQVFVLGQDVPEDMERDELDAGADHAVAFDGAVLLGTGRLLSPDQLGRTDGVGGVGRMAVAEAARGRRVGAALLDRLEARARERGFAGIELHAQEHARGFYARAGYRVVGEPYEEAGIPHISMERSLPT